MKLSNLTHDAGHPLSRHKYGDLPASYLFVETVVGTGVLSENTANRFGNAINAAIARLQNFMTPGASSDLEALLGFFAPTGGGLPKVQEMVKKAGELQTPVTQDEAWWQQMTGVFGVKDPSIVQQIKDKTAQGAGQAPGQQAQAPAPAAATPAAGAATPAGAAAPAGGAVPAAGAAGGMDPAAMQEILKQQEAVKGNSAELMGMLDQNTKAREASMARIRELRAKMDALQAKRGGAPAPAPTPTPTEAVFNELATALLNEADVKSNLRFVASNLMRRLGYASTTPVQEVNWLKKFATPFNRQPRTMDEGFRDFFRNMRMNLANPGHANMQSQNAELKAYNGRAAKLAVQYMSDYLTAKFKSQLAVANLQPNDVMAAMRGWQQYDKAYEQMKKAGTTPDAKFVEGYKAAFAKIRQVIAAIDPSTAGVGSTT